MIQFNGTFLLVGDISSEIGLRNKEVCSAVISTVQLTGSIVLERAIKGGWEVVARLADSGSIEYMNVSGKLERLRLRCAAIDEVAEEEVFYTFKKNIGEVVKQKFSSFDGAVLAELLDNNNIRVKVPVIFEAVSSEELTSGGSPVSVSTSLFKTEIVTGGTEGSESVEIGDGTGVEIGTRKLITLKTQTDPADIVELDDANFSQGSDVITAIELDAEGEFVFAEWRGLSWEILSASAGVVSV